VLSTAGRRVSGLCGFAAEPKWPAAPSLRRPSLGGSVRQLLSSSTYYGYTDYASTNSGYTHFLLGAPAARAR
jgi:hypothetical protein